MREYAITLLVALIGGFAGGVAVRWLGQRMRGLPGFSRRHAEPSTPPHMDGASDRRQLDAIRSDLWALKESVGRVLQDVGDLSRRLESAPLATGGGSSPDAPARRGGEPPRRETGGWSRGPDAGYAGAGTYRDPAPPRPTPYDAPPAMEYDVDPGTGWGAGRGTGYDAERGHEAGRGYDAGRANAYDPPAPGEAAPRAPAGPPPGAINVEARDDRIVASSSYPPEAWLETRGPAVAHLWLNPSVALNENALRRLSTFFQWQGERPGATYDTDQPAVLRWDEGQRVGTVTQRGSARPR